MYDVLIFAYILIIGVITGSFLNVCIYRIPKGESVSFPYSHCTSCNNKIKPYDLIPILSYLFLGGRCRNCGEKIALRYLLVEALTGILAVALYLRHGLALVTLSYFLFTTLLIVVAFIDLDVMEIYDRVIATGFILAFVLNFICYGSGFLLDKLFAMFLGSGVFLLIAIASKGAMGGGDIKLMALVGFWLGVKLLVSSFYCSIFTAFLVILPMLIAKKKKMKDEIPFGVFIAIGTFLSMMSGERIFDLLFGRL